jgi:hypothetical protein
MKTLGSFDLPGWAMMEPWMVTKEGCRTRPTSGEDGA